MTKRAKALVIIISVPLLVFFLWHVGWGCFRCWSYHKIIAIHPDGLVNLSGKPSRLEVPQDNNNPVLSLGYARVGIPPESIGMITCIGDAKTHIVVATNECKFLFIPPCSSTWSILDPNSVRTSRLPSIFRYDPFGYNFGVRAANTMPKGYATIFFMHPQEFLEYLILAAAKAQEVMNQNGVGYFETEYIRGIIHFGDIKRPGIFFVTVYSKEANILQNIRVSFNDPAKSKKALLSLLSSYRFVVTKIPDEDTLQQLIITEIRKHDKFKQVEQPLNRATIPDSTK